MRYVFGKTLICRNMEVATKFARLHGLDCITLDGDQVSRRGALTGGYIDTKRSRLELHHSKIELRSRMDEKEAEYRENRSHLSQIDTELNNFNRNIQNVETELSKCKELYDRYVTWCHRVKPEVKKIIQTFGYVFPKNGRIPTIFEINRRTRKSFEQNANASRTTRTGMTHNLNDSYYYDSFCQTGTRWISRRTG